MLSHKQHYLQVACNSTIQESLRIIASLPPTNRILLEAGTPLIKQEGAYAIRQLQNAWTNRLLSAGISDTAYVVADLKCMDRGEREVAIAASGGASAAIALGQAPVETLNAFIKACHEREMDSMIDMMNVEKPYQVLRKLKKLPVVVILHRGVDEEELGNKPLPIH
ncbi:MAG: orotidine 5'-phosphate decarboxylase, partial [Candidatus Roizmanbacteria bacterium]|nr:orotidine 5'-phosphate decarboxylase [Candidatus Roizmanbacteria bacterium]